MLRCKSVDTPMDSKTKLRAKENGALVEKGKYQRLVGKLIYLSQIRPNISFSISVVSQFMNNPTKEHIRGCTSNPKMPKDDIKKRFIL